MSARQKLRAWLVLARASNLPTVWSNCIAGCWLGGWAPGATIVLLCGAGSLLYTGGMFLNDFCDVGFDREYKPDRPIIAGAVSRRQAGLAAIVLLFAGLLLASAIKPKVLLFAFLLAGAIITYDLLHKRVAWAPLLMAGCRFLLYLAAAAAGAFGITPRAIVFAIALGLYVVALSYLARGESRAHRGSRWWSLLLFAPVFIALYFQLASFTLLCALPLLIWILCALGVVKQNVGRGVAMLLAGIVWLDLLAVSPLSLLAWLGFAALFAAGLLFQRYVPAT